MTNSVLCLALAVLIRSEAGPDRDEQELVASVALNRFRDPAQRWGTSWEQVIFRRGQFAVWDHIPRERIEWQRDKLIHEDAEAWFHAVTLAMAAIEGTLELATKATHFHSTHISKPASWSRCLFLEQTQWHKFYKED